MQIVFKKARRVSYVDPAGEVKNPGSRGGRWFYDKNHHIQYGDPPSGYEGLHSGDFHNMFVRHMEPGNQRNVIRDLHLKAHDKELPPEKFVAQTLTQAQILHNYSANRAREESFKTGNREDYHRAIDKFGNLLSSVHEHATRLGIDKDKDFSEAYHAARRNHARHLVDSGRYSVRLPSKEELENVAVPKTHEDLKNWATQYLPHVHFEVDSMDIEVADSLVFSFLATAADYDPEVLKTFRHFGTREGEQHKWGPEYAHVSSNGELLGINPKYSSDKQGITERIERDRAVGWTKGKALADVSTHEYGHLLDFYLSKHPQWDLLMMDWKRAHTDQGKYGSISDYAAHDDNKRRSFVDTLMKPEYANTRPEHDRREQWAESLVSLHTDEPEKQSNYTTHQRRLLDFVRDNPNFDGSKDFVEPHVLQSLGIVDPIHVRIK